MDKEYMLSMVKVRIAELESIYRGYFDTDKGPSKTYMGSACLRSRTLKDINTLKLIEYLLMYCPDTMIIDDPTITAAFDRLAEPRRLKR